MAAKQATPLCAQGLPKAAYFLAEPRILLLTMDFCDQMSDYRDATAQSKPLVRSTDSGLQRGRAASGCRRLIIKCLTFRFSAPLSSNCTAVIAT